MSGPIGKSATRMWREQLKGGQTTLPFAAWINREKEKISADASSSSGLVLVDRTLNDSVHQIITDTTTAGGLQTKPTGKTILGIKTPIFIVGAVLLATASIILITQISKK